MKLDIFGKLIASSRYYKYSKLLITRAFKGAKKILRVMECLSYRGCQQHEHRGKVVIFSSYRGFLCNEQQQQRNDIGQEWTISLNWELFTEKQFRVSVSNCFFSPILIVLQ